jgi:hypothetical protein
VTPKLMYSPSLASSSSPMSSVVPRLSWLPQQRIWFVSRMAQVWRPEGDGAELVGLAVTLSCGRPQTELPVVVAAPAAHVTAREQRAGVARAGGERDDRGGVAIWFAAIRWDVVAVVALLVVLHDAILATRLLTGSTHAGPPTQAGLDRDQIGTTDPKLLTGAEHEPRLVPLALRHDLRAGGRGPIAVLRRAAGLHLLPDTARIAEQDLLLVRPRAAELEELAAALPHLERRGRSPCASAGGLGHGRGFARDAGAAARAPSAPSPVGDGIPSSGCGARGGGRRGAASTSPNAGRSVA